MSPIGVSTKDVNKMEKIDEIEKAFPSGEQLTNTSSVGYQTIIKYPLGYELKTEEYRWKKVFHCLRYGRYFTLRKKCFNCPLLLSFYGRTKD